MLNTLVEHIDSIVNSVFIAVVSMILGRLPD